MTVWSLPYYGLRRGFLCRSELKGIWSWGADDFLTKPINQHELLPDEVFGWCSIVVHGSAKNNPKELTELMFVWKVV